MREIRNCNVCVVGGAGFLGSHLVNHLIDDRNCSVLVVDNLISGRREFVHEKAKFLHHDITGSESYLRDVLIGNNIRFVLNYAARPYVPDSYARPLRTADVNFMGAFKVINAAQEAGCEAILQVSSAEVYGSAYAPTALDPEEASRQEVKIREDAPVTPHSSYGASKAAIDALCQVRWREANTPVIALRQFNCLGERETHIYVVPEIISQLSKFGTHPVYKDKIVVKLGNNSFRDFLYAGDAVRIAVELLKCGNFGEVYNLGSERGIKIYDLAKLIGKLMGFAEVRVEEDAARKRPWEIWHLQSDNSKIKSVCNGLGHCWTWSALTPLEEALRRTIRWYEVQGGEWPWET